MDLSLNTCGVTAQDSSWFLAQAGRVGKWLGIRVRGGVTGLMLQSSVGAVCALGSAVAPSRREANMGPKEIPLIVAFGVGGQCMIYEVSARDTVWYMH